MNLDRVTVFGSPYSVYVRIVRLALLEKGVTYKLEPVDIFADNGKSEAHLKRHPFGKIPAFSHNRLKVYETSAITRYIDEAFTGPALMPETPADRARANQIMSIIDNYGYRAMVWGVYVALNESKNGVALGPNYSKSIKVSQTVVDQLEFFAKPKSQFLLGDEITLADLFVTPVLTYFMKTEAGRSMVEDTHKLKKCWDNLQTRPGYEEILSTD